MLAPTFKDIVAAREFIDSPAQPTCKEVAEGAGAASLAAAIKIRDGLRGKKVVGIATGGNIPLERFAKLMTEKSEY
ncbi:MAG TPA: hypothetical protein VES69_03295 [Pyrinomonadaceae bacterium]|nr:hypothetical protein [Pyrinomonadaceae bacterium]